MWNDAISRQRGSIAAPDRPALGPQLDRSTEPEVAEEMARDNLHCHEISRKRGSSDVLTGIVIVRLDCGADRRRPTV